MLAILKKLSLQRSQLRLVLNMIAQLVAPHVLADALTHNAKGPKHLDRRSLPQTSARSPSKALQSLALACCAGSSYPLSIATPMSKLPLASPNLSPVRARRRAARRVRSKWLVSMCLCGRASLRRPRRTYHSPRLDRTASRICLCLCFASPPHAPATRRSYAYYVQCIFLSFSTPLSSSSPLTSRARDSSFLDWPSGCFRRCRSSSRRRLDLQLRTGCSTQCSTQISFCMCSCARVAPVELSHYFLLSTVSSPLAFICIY